LDLGGWHRRAQGPGRLLEDSRPDPFWRDLAGLEGERAADAAAGHQPPGEQSWLR